MSNYFDIPVLLVGFSRPDTTQQVIEAIREARPQRLYVALDAPRPHKTGEAELCEQTKRVILDTIDWDCELQTLFREQNLGCARGVSGAVTWFLEHEEMGIILEDDCVPSQSFFSYCRELLHRYRNDERIMHISGFNVQQGIQRGDASYYFSRYAELWGWATWRRAWQQFDFEMTSFAEYLEQDGLAATFRHRGVQKRWVQNLDQVLSEDPPTVWGYRWLYSIWKESGLAITPNVSLTQNIGFDERAVHTKATNHQFAQIGAHEMAQLTHPSVVVPHEAADVLTSMLRYHPPILKRAQLKAKRLAQEKLGW